MDASSERERDESVNLLTVQAVWPFVLIVLVLLVAMVLSLELMSSVRAFVGAESLWSKGQKQAVISLASYSHSQREESYQDYLQAIGVTLGDHEARLALNQAKPDWNVAYRGFLAGGSNARDIPGMIRLYRHFGKTSLMEKPIRIWTTADIQIASLIEIGELIRQEVVAGHRGESRAKEYRARLELINRTVTPLENEFSSSLAQASIRVQQLIGTFLGVLTLLLLTLGIWFSRRLAAQRIASARDLRKESEINHAFLKNASDGIHILDAEGHVRKASDSFCVMVGHDRDSIVGMDVSSWDAQLSKAELGGIFRDMIKRDASMQLETRIRNQAGVIFDVELSAAPLRLDGRDLIYASARDITRRKQAEKALRESEERLNALYSGAPDGILILDAETHRITDANPRICAMLGLTRGQLIQSELDGIFFHDGSFEPSRYLMGMAEEQIEGAQEVSLRASDGQMIPVDVSASRIEVDGSGYLACFLRDVTERQRAKAQIDFMAHHDLLTGLPNRGLFLDHLRRALAEAKEGGLFGAVLFVDLDHFKNINDVHGHFAGDQVLKQIARRLGCHLREGDTVARLGGDEFVILLPRLSLSEDVAVSMALTLGERVRAALDEPVRHEGQQFTSTASIGISLFPRDGASVEDVIREADIAMYRSKESGRNTMILFEDEMEERITERCALERDLREAIKSESLEIYMQSKKDVDGQLVGAEALARWNHPTRGMIPPSVFIPMAEQSDLILAFGDWVFEQVCRMSAGIARSGRCMNLAVNVSPRQFYQRNFVSRVKDIIEKTGADPRCLTLEITENLLIEQTAVVVSRMHELAEIGIRFSIDDFGTGYSSLAYLKRLPLKELKIDKSFVQDVPGDANDVALVETILSIARHLQLDVVAEGVESQSQLEFMTGRGCTLFQGFLVHQPQAAREWLESFGPEHAAMSPA